MPVENVVGMFYLECINESEWLLEHLTPLMDRVCERLAIVTLIVRQSEARWERTICYVMRCHMIILYRLLILRNENAESCRKSNTDISGLG
jgi:hypothetical protein